MFGERQSETNGRDGFTNGRDVENVYHLTIRDCSAFTDPQMLGKVHRLELYTFVGSFEGLGNISVQGRKAVLSHFY
jgi:hypothetical protein